MEIVQFVIWPALLGGVGGFVDNLMKREPPVPCAIRGIVSAGVMAIVAFTIWATYHVHLGG